MKKIQLQAASLVSNTEQNIVKWLQVVNRYCTLANTAPRIELINDVVTLKDFLCRFITWLCKKMERNIKSNRYQFPRALRTSDGKMRLLQDQGLGDPKVAEGLSVHDIEKLLDHEYMK
ncbi:8603_t:CDS:2, partial [Scutellospora calospora]